MICSNCGSPSLSYERDVGYFREGSVVYICNACGARCLKSEQGLRHEAREGFKQSSQTSNSALLGFLFVGGILLLTDSLNPTMLVILGILISINLIIIITSAFMSRRI